MALLPDKQAAKAAIEDLQTADVEISTVRVLHGEEGADILDPTGAEHGSATRIIRWLQTRGYDRNILDVYEEGLNNGEALITVQCAPADSRRLGRVMLPWRTRSHLLRSRYGGDVDGALGNRMTWRLTRANGCALKPSY